MHDVVIRGGTGSLRGRTLSPTDRLFDGYRGADWLKGGPPGEGNEGAVLSLGMLVLRIVSFW